MLTEIHSPLLVYYEACEDDVLTFIDLFPDGAEVTRENADLAHRHGIDILWIVNLVPYEKGYVALNKRRMDIVIETEVHRRMGTLFKDGNRKLLRDRSVDLFMEACQLITEFD